MRKLIKRITAIAIVLAIFIPQTAVLAATSFNIKVTSTEDYAKAFECLDIVNQERIALGLNELKMDSDLLEAAMLRAAELTVVYSHTRPSDRSFYTVLDDMGITRYYTGENAAMARSSATTVMNSWMNSTGHKNNILNTNYQRMGIGVVYHNGLYYWVQIFDGLTTSNEALLRSDTPAVQRTISVSSEITIGSAPLQPIKFSNT